VDQPEDIDPFPIVLPGPRPTRWIFPGLLAGGTTAVFVIAFSVDCSGCVKWGVTLGSVLAFLTFAAAVDRMLRPRRPRQLVIDRTGFVNDGRRVPWESVESIMWMAPRWGDAGYPVSYPAHIQVDVRSTNAPRRDVVPVFHADFGIAANRLIYLFEAAALPRRLSVLAVEPPSSRRSWNP
jgi:hypothetical protein